MIKVLVSNNNGRINKVSVKGHAGFDDYNKDIVCSAVSSITMTTINALVTLDDKFIYKQNDNELVLFNNSDVTDKLLNNMVNMLEELSDQYKKNIIIRKEEK